eukprot:12892445-Prorocentrum_lima.AAC.1
MRHLVTCITCLRATLHVGELENALAALATTHPTCNNPPKPTYTNLPCATPHCDAWMLPSPQINLLQIHVP